MLHRLVARVALLAHLTFLVFALLGGLLAWLAPWVLLPHIASAMWGARMAVLPRACPLSRAEDWGRSGSGRPPLHERGFVAHYFEGTVYPGSWAKRVTMVAGALVVGSWIGLAVK